MPPQSAEEMGLVEVVRASGYVTPGAGGLHYTCGSRIERPWLECKLGVAAGDLKIIRKIKPES